MADSSHSTLFKGLEMGDIKVKNSRGSSAGAGSGDCHHYLQGRREEIFRVERMQQDSEKAKKDKEWKAELDARIAESEAEKAKRAAKRNKKKLKRKAVQEDGPDSKKSKIEEKDSDEIHKFAESPKPEEVIKEAEANPKATTGILLKED